MKTKETAPALFDAWNLTADWAITEVDWPETIRGMSTADLSAWGRGQVARALSEALPSARLAAAPGVGFVGIADGREFTVIVKCQLPACRLRPLRGAPSQGVETGGELRAWLEGQEQSGVACYVVWTWAEPGDRVLVLGGRVDVLAREVHATSLNRKRGGRRVEMSYWTLASLWPMSKLADDVLHGGPQGLQPALLPEPS